MLNNYTHFFLINDRHLFYNLAMAKILIADDEEKIREMIGKYAKHEGLEVALAKDGLEALELFKKEDFDVVILDVMMPNMDGFETLKKMKEVKDVHCIFLTALGEESDRLYGFDTGGEDYVTKPFSPKELMFRIKVILRRYSKDSEVISIDGLVMDLNAHSVTIDGKRIELPNKEYELLLLLLKNKGKALTREYIINTIWGYEYDSDDRTLDTHMKLLRKDIGEYGKYITTIRGVGYRLKNTFKYVFLKF